MQRRGFLNLAAMAGIGLFSDRTLFAQDKPFLLATPIVGEALYVTLGRPVKVIRKHRGFPRIARIDFSWSGRLIRSLTTPPYEFVWHPGPDDTGYHDFTAQAVQAGTGHVIWTRTIYLSVITLPPNRP